MSKIDFSAVRRALLAKMMESEGLATRVAQGIPVREERDRAPLSLTQRRLWFINQLEPDNPVYNNHFAFRLKGTLNLPALQHAVDEIVNRHEILRTTFAMEGSEPVQIITDLEVKILVLDVDESSGETPDSTITKLAAQEARRPFNLQRGPLLRMTVWQFSEGDRKGDSVLLFTIHHIISDGWSLGVFIEELTSLYQAYLIKTSSPLSELRVQYGDFAAWQKNWLDTTVRAAQLPYWKEKLADSPSSVDLPFDHARPPVQRFHGARETLHITHELGEQLRALSQVTGRTMFMLLLAGFKALLCRYTRQQDIVIGTPVAGRPRPEVENLIGFFANTVVFRTNVSDDLTFAELLDRVSETTISALAHQDIPFEVLVEELNPERGLDQNPLFQIAFALHKGQTQEFHLPDLTLERLDVDSGTSKFDLTLELVDTGEELIGAFEYNSDLFDGRTIRRLAGHFVNLLEGVVADPQQQLYNLPLLSEAEHRQVEIEWNETTVEYDRSPCVFHLFERHVEEEPEAIALVSTDGALTYRKLNARANQLAHHLQALGIGPEKIVGICLDRSFDFVIAALGVFKAGGAYVPLDHAYPSERLQYMLQDSCAGVLLTNQKLASGLDTSATKICLDSDWETIAKRSCLNSSSQVTAQNLAYVIYTSGSTGQPKGVAVEHQGLVNLVQWHRRVYELDHSDRTTQVAGLGFDACVWEMWAALASGASLWLPDDETRNSPEKLKDWLLACGITVSFLPTPLAEAVLALNWPREAPLRALLTGGDRLREYPAPELPFQLMNHYGPTESSVVTTWTPVHPKNGTPELPSIGHPIDNTRVYLVDRHLKLVPVRTPGELYITGTGLARGYLNRPDLTAESYLPNPFATSPGERLYKSGDLARHNLDGSIEFLHRGDHQIKIRGFRVELQEMEFALRQHPSVSDAVVTFDEKQSIRSQLVAYVVADKIVQPAELKSFLKDRLPDYMVPTCYVMLDQMPLTPNGKVDRRALPAPQEEVTDAAARPLDPLEEIVAGLWAEVLGVQNVGAEDNFFDLGGHSLLATQVVSRVRNSLGVEVPLRTIFANPTVAGMCAEIRQRTGTGLRPAAQVRAAGAEIPLSLAQQRLWFIDQLEPGTGAYNIAAAVRLSGELERDALGAALNEIVRRHEVLRTRFESRDGHPIQIVEAAAGQELPLLDLSTLEETVQQQRVAELAREEAGRGFDLSQGRLLRTTLLRLNETEHVLLVTMHHIISDGWSVGVMVRELSELYEAYREGKESPLAELQLQYGDYAVWQREQEQAGAEHMDYWREQLAGVPVLELPTDRPHPAVASYRGSSENFSLGTELSRSLKALSRREGVTLFMTLLSGFQVLLARYSGQEDIAVGTPSAGRQQAEIEALIGFFVNTLVMRTDLSGNPTVSELLRRVREMSLAAYERQEVPFERLVEELQPERSLTHQPLFQVMFLLQDSPLKSLSLPGLDCVDLKTETQTSQFDLTLAASEEAEEISFSITYATDLFDASTVRRLGNHFRRVLEEMAADAQTHILELPLLNAAENRQILVEFNDTATAYDQPACIHQLFERQVQRTPDATALVYEEQSVSYRELNRRANQLGNYLKAQGVGLETRVAICMERSVEMVVSLLGVLKAGGAYVPIDPWYPRERIEYMLGNAAAEVVLTQGHLAERLSESGVMVVSVDEEWETICAQSGSNCETAVSGENLVYVIYTSGSTGFPKGAMNTHAAVSNRLLWMHEQYGLNDTDRVLQKTPYTFDVSGWEFFWPLVAGGCLVMARPEGHRDPDYLNETIQTAGITKIHFVPPMLRTWLASDGAARCTSLKQVFCSGEALDAESVARFHSCLNAEIHNLYGPTEAAIDVTYWHCSPDWDEDFIPIGKPIANTQIYILDQRLQPVPIGVSGELYIGGNGLARGYLNRADLTAEKFIANPFSQEPGARLYRSGDLARFRADGEIEYLGRIDHQVKLRGYRIELGEIEAVLSEYEGVEQAVVVLRAEEQRLVAYYVAEGLSSEQLRAYVSGRVPEYMVPSVFVKLEQMPLTENGKIDRRTLPKPEAGTGSAEYVRPRNKVEEVLCAIWSELLGVERVGIHDNFFHIGGHSLLATQVVSRVRNSLGVEVPLRTIFANPTVAGMCAEIRQRTGTGLRPAAQVRAAGAEIPLSLAQQRLWFVDQLEQGTGAYNIPAAVRLSGQLERDALGQALNEIVRRHEVLRTRFESRGGNPIQIVEAAAGQELPLLDLSTLEETVQQQRVAELAREEAGRGFDLSQGRLLRTTLLRLNETEHVLLVTMHHIISDGWSVGVMVRELSELYEAYREGKESPLAELQLQYGDYAVWQREQEQAGAEHMDYWREQLAGVPVLELPTDRPHPAVASYRGSSESFSLGAELSRELKALSRREGVTLFMTLLSGFQVLLARYSGQEDIAVGTPSAGRQQAEIEALIGFFVNTLVMRTDLSGNPTVSELLRRVREMSLAAYEHQEVPFERLVEELQPERSLTHQPLFQVWFVLQNTPAVKVNIPGLNIESIPIEDSFSKYDLMLSIDESEESLPGTLHFRTDLFDRSTVQRMLEHFRRVLEEMAANAQKHILELSLLNPAENRQILVEFNDTATAYDRDACVHQLFERQVERTPDATALVYEEQSVSYRELNRRANQLANYLKAQGVGLETRVAICMERSVEMVVSLLGVLKAGGAYVPIDPGYPRERIEYMLGNAAAEVVLTQAHLAESLSESGVMVVSVDEEWETIGTQSGSNCETAVGGENLVYVIYTSGSTGLPKGVGVTHQGLTNYLTWTASTSYTAGRGQCPVHSSLSFDLVVTSIYAPLLSGQSLALLPNREELDALGTGLAEDRFDLLKLTPSHLKALSQLVKGKMPAQSEGCFVIGGEALTYEDLSFWQSSAPAVRLINEYGPTETIVGCCVYEAREPGSGRVPIGKPIANTQIYILDQRLQPVPIGVSGELYIGGDGLARGYLNRADLTAEKLIADPFSSQPGARLYRSGDLARFRADGEIEYLGRIDHQVKLRGYRIELGEIEAVLSEYEGVEQAVVVLRAEEQRLVAYYVAEGLSSEQLRAYVSGRVPEYMVPSAFVKMEQMPLTGNGKVDQRALPKPEAVADTAGYVGPRNETEEVLCGIWMELLDVEHVGIHDNFFELGGDSILSIQVVARAREAGIQLIPKHFFEHQTIAQLAAVAAETAQGQPKQDVSLPFEFAGTDLEKLKESDPQIEDIYPLSPTQKGMLFHSLFAPESGVYFDQLIFTFRGELNDAAFRQAWKQVVNHHAALRTAFLWEDLSEPVQVVRRHVELPWEEQDWRQLGLAEQQEELEAYINADRKRAVDLSRAPLMRFCLVRTSDDGYQLIWSRHHLLLDGWSGAVMLKQVFNCYASLSQGELIQLEEPRPYKDYIVWLNEQNKSAAESFWRDTLQGHQEPTPLCIDSVKRQGDTTETYGKHEIQLPHESTSKLREFARRHQLTLNTIIEGAWGLLLSRYSCQSRVVFGTTVAGRPTELDGVERMVGLFINTVPLMVEVDQHQAVATWLQQLQQKHADVREYEYSSLVEIQGWSDVPRGRPLFESLFVFENYPVDATLLETAQGGLEIQEVRTSEQTNYPLTLVALPGDELALRINYQQQRFPESAIARMLGHLHCLLESIVARPEQAIAQLDLMPAGEREQILDTWSDTVSEYPVELCLHELFEQQVARTPEATALVHEEQRLSYRELNRRANQLAHHLRELGVGPEVRVAICMERGVEMVIGLLGVLKAGGVYVPIDPAYPRERVEYILNNSAVVAVLTQPQLADKLTEHSLPLVIVDPANRQIAQQPDTNLNTVVTPENLAYIIYTSGSTGTPKGVMVTHQNVARLFAATEQWFNFNADDVWTMFHSFAFDFSVWEIYGALLYGGRLVIVPYWISRSPEAFYELLAEEGVTVLNQTPSAFQQLMRVDEASAGRLAPELRLVIFGGEALELQSLQPWFERHGDEHPQLVNMYGITETTVHVTYRPLVKEDAQGGASVIGRQIPDLQIYILDEQFRPVPAGIAGEMYVGGAGVARGYVNRPDLATQRFVPHPFSTTAGARLYRTGDLARWSDSGELEYLGRNDHQVKIRGFRIETGEIETALLERKEVGQAVVLVREEEGRGKQLAAYVVPSNGIEPNARELRSYLQERLPEYMVPASIAVLATLPLTSNGKIDRQSLLSLSRMLVESDGEGAQNDVEALLVQVWQEVLGLEQVGIHDNFFELGGDSILSIQIVAKAKRSGLTLKVQQIFQYQTIAELARVVSTTQNATELDEAIGEVPLTPIQLRFFELGLPNPHHFNQAVMLEVDPRPELSLLQTVINKLVEHHDALRLRFTESADGWQQAYAETETQQLVSAIDLSHLPLDEQQRQLEMHAAAAQASLDITAGPLLRVVLFDLGDERPARLLIAIHHLAIDGVSWRILMEDLQTAYDQARRGEEIALPGKTNSFKRWSQSLQQYASSAELESQASYWLDERRRDVPRLPVDFEQGENTVGSANSIMVELSPEETHTLLQEVPKAYHTQIQEVLATAVALALREWAGSDKVLLEMEGHGREDVVAGVDVSRTVGWFTSVYPVLLELEGDEISTALKSTKEQLRAVPQRGIGYGIWKYLRAGETERAQLREMAAAEVSFNYLGQFDQVLSSEEFRAAADSTGAVQDERGKREHLIAINGMVADGQLRMTWGYSEAVHRGETIERVAAEFADVLRELIEHCQSEDAGGHTPSDFPLAQLDQQSLDMLVGSFEAF